MRNEFTAVIEHDGDCRNQWNVGAPFWNRLDLPRE